MNIVRAILLGLWSTSMLFAHTGPVSAGELRVAYSILHHEALGDGVSGFLQLSVENDAFSEAQNVDLRIAPGTVVVGGNGVVQLSAVPAGEIRSAVASFLSLADFPADGAPIEVIVDLDTAGVHEAYRVMAQAQ